MRRLTRAIRLRRASRLFRDLQPNEPLTEIGRILDTERREIMLRRDLGLTKLYNLINDPDIADSADSDVARMREIHVELDHGGHGCLRLGRRAA